MKTQLGDGEKDAALKKAAAPNPDPDSHIDAISGYCANWHLHIRPCKELRVTSKSVLTLRSNTQTFKPRLWRPHHNLDSNANSDP